MDKCTLYFIIPTPRFAGPFRYLKHRQMLFTINPSPPAGRVWLCQQPSRRQTYNLATDE